MNESKWFDGCDEPYLIEQELRAWSTYVNKKSMFRMQELMSFYKVHGKEPLVFLRCKGGSGHEIVHQHGSPICSSNLEWDDYQTGKDSIPFPGTRDENTVSTFKVMMYSEHMAVIKNAMKQYLDK
jgi:hypothetical protein